MSNSNLKGNRLEVAVIMILVLGATFVFAEIAIIFANVVVPAALRTVSSTI